MDATNTWASIKQWLNDNNASEIVDNLNDGATPEEIAATEATLGIQFPEAFKAFYAVHNGQNGEALPISYDGELLALDEIVNQYQIWQELAASGEFDGINSEAASGIKGDWWNAKWIPITHNGSGDHLCLDFDPAPGGTQGQIITMWHDDPARHIVATSFEEWITGYANDLQAGKYKYDEDFGVDKV